MPFIPNTPESLLRRSDSKDPALTCKGITTTGRHCRQTLASPVPSPTQNGVVAVLPALDERDGAAAWFCWRHKDQATTLAAADGNGRKGTVTELKSRTSIDSLAERLNIPDVGNKKPSNFLWNRWEEVPPPRAARKETLPPQWQKVNGPLIAVEQPGWHRKRKNKLRRFCCWNIDDTEFTLPVQARKHVEKPEMKSTRVPAYKQPAERQNEPHTPQRQSRRHSTAEIQTELHTSPQRHSRRHSTAEGQNELRTPQRQSRRHSTTSSPPSSAIPSPTRRPKAHRQPSTQTQALLSLIPPTLSPQTTALLLTELAKPVSAADEKGYIYVFWLTNALTDPTAAEALLSSPSPRRRSAQTLPKSPANSSQTLLLKIGRASNVQRRMNEWTRQCGYHLSLVRSYPYPSTTTTHKVPHAHKVERLIHLELVDQRVKRACGNCGKEHREWFEVQGSRDGVKAIDAVVRRWVDWAFGGGGR